SMVIDERNTAVINPFRHIAHPPLNSSRALSASEEDGDSPSSTRPAGVIARHQRLTFSLTRDGTGGKLSVTVFRLVTFGGLAIEAENGAAPPRLRPPRLALL